MRSDDKGNFQKIGEGLGGLAGQAADQAANMFGSILGSMTNAMDGWFGSESADRAARSFGTEEDRACRQHHEARSGQSSSGSYEERRPLYQFGHVAGRNPRYQGRRFEEVESDLQKAWGREQSEVYGDWPEVRGYVGFGYEQGSRGGGGEAGAGGEIDIRAEGDVERS